MPEKVTACVKCGGPLEQPTTGRPRVYCSSPCRTAAAYEVQRINRRLLALEERASELRHSRSSTRDWLARTPQQALSDVEAEIAAAEGRLRQLLAEPRGKSPERARRNA
jgi:sugar-specific transcriptional regulator TrmB